MIPHTTMAQTDANERLTLIEKLDGYHQPL